MCEAFVILSAFAGGASSRALCADGLCHYHRFLPHITGRNLERCPYCAAAPTHQLCVLTHTYMSKNELFRGETMAIPG